MLQLLESEVLPINCRLRKSDAFDSASDIIFDEAKTLEDVGVQTEDLLFLEIGKVII